MQEKRHQNGGSRQKSSEDSHPSGEPDDNHDGQHQVKLETALGQE